MRDPRNRRLQRTVAAALAGVLSMMLAVADASAIGPEGPVIGALGPQINIEHAESDTNYGTVVGQGPVLFARTAPAMDGNADGWLLRFDVRVRNQIVLNQVVNRIVAFTDVSGPVSRTFNPAVPVAGSGSATLFSPDLRGGRQKPSTVTVRVYAGWNPIPKQRTFKVQVHDNATPSGGYKFPAKASDLPAGTFWTTADGHAHTTLQRYAYDFAVIRWNGTLNDWDYFTPKAYADSVQGIAMGSRNDHYLIWGQPVYAMADGLIVSCRRSRPDNTPGVSVPGANSLIADGGNGEFAIYAHFMQGSMPAELCPVQAPLDGSPYTATPISIKTGDFLGLVGNSGPSTGPHLHMHIEDGDPTLTQSRGRGLPLNFFDVAVRTFRDYDYSTDSAAPAFLSADRPASVDWYSLILPNPCGPVGGTFGWGTSRTCDVIPG